MNGTSSNSIIPLKKVYCSNCGKQGHLYKQCQDAVTSYGIILYKENLGLFTVGFTNSIKR